MPLSMTNAITTNDRIPNDQTTNVTEDYSSDQTTNVTECFMTERLKSE